MNAPSSSPPLSHGVRATRLSQKAWVLLRTTYEEWSRHNAATLAAALAYYTAFAIAPVLILLIAVFGFAFDRAAVQAEAMHQLQITMGPQAAEVVQMLLHNATRPGASLVATTISVLTILLSATGVFVEVQRSMDIIWNVPPDISQSLWFTVRERIFGFFMVVSVGALLVVSLLGSAVLGALGFLLERRIPGVHFGLLVANAIFSFGLVTLLFAMTYKFLPRTRIRWGDVWVGALATSLLFSLGKVALGLYFAKSALASSYGAAGSFAVLLAWVYYSAQILFFGAEFAQVYARLYGSHPVESMAALGTASKPVSVVTETLKVDHE